MTDRRLTAEEADSFRLPGGPCCCGDHPHDWYQRNQAPGDPGAPEAEEWWLECNACGADRPLRRPVTEADCRLIGAGDGSVMVYCKPCREALDHRAFRGTLNTAVSVWEEHTAQHHALPPVPVVVPDPWFNPDAASAKEPPPF